MKQQRLFNLSHNNDSANQCTMFNWHQWRI